MLSQRGYLVSRIRRERPDAADRLRAPSMSAPEGERGSCAAPAPCPMLKRQVVEQPIKDRLSISPFAFLWCRAPRRIEMREVDLGVQARGDARVRGHLLAIVSSRDVYSARQYG